MSTKKSLKPSPKKRKPSKRGRCNGRSTTSWLRLSNDEPDQQHVPTTEPASERLMMYVLEPEQESDLWLVRLAEFYVRLDKPAFQTEIEQIVFGATGIPCTVEPSMIMSHPPAHVHVDKLQKDGLAAIRRVAMSPDNRTKVVRVPVGQDEAVIAGIRTGAIRVSCPVCHGPIAATDREDDCEALNCEGCGGVWEMRDGLLVGVREDEEPDALSDER